MRKHQLRKFISLWVMLLVAAQVACAQETEATAEPDATPTPEAVEAAAQTGVFGADEKLLVWTAPGDQPGSFGASEPGQIAYLNADGSLDPLLTLPPQITRVVPCGGPLAESPDGGHFAFFVGNDTTGTLYMIDGTSTDVVTVQTDVSTMACTGGGTFAFSGDSSRYAYMDFTGDFTNDLSPVARLRLYDAASNTQITDFENVAAFDLTGDGVALVNFFNNNDNQAVEVAVRVWTPDADREVATLFADEEGDDCYYTSASVKALSGSRLAAVMGYRCARGEFAGRTQWQYYVIDTENRSATLAQSDGASGGYFGFTSTNTTYNAPGTDTIFFTLPDGISNRTTALVTTDISGASPRVILNRNVIMPSLSTLPYQPDNHVPVISPDGRWLALTTGDVDGNAQLHVIDMSAPDLPPITLDAGSRGDTIAEMLFAPDSSRLLFVAGGNSGANNAAFVLDLATGSEFRAARGRFEQGVIAPDGNRLALVNWDQFDDEEAPLQTLVVLDVESGQTTTLFEGGEIVEGEVQNAQFAYPLSWRTN